MHHRRHRRSRPPRARRPARVRAAAASSDWTRSSTASSIPAGRGDSPGPSRSCSPTSPRRSTPASSTTARGRSASPRRSRRSSIRSLSWDDIEWFRSMWNGPIVLKGVQTVDDAAARRRPRRSTRSPCPTTVAASSTARRRSSTSSPRSPMPSAGAIEIICDGGVRRGSDIVKALALGADACMVGRAYLYGLGAAGELGVDRVLEWLARRRAPDDGAARSHLDRRDHRRPHQSADLTPLSGRPTSRTRRAPTGCTRRCDAGGAVLRRRKQRCSDSVVGAGG